MLRSLTETHIKRFLNCIRNCTYPKGKPFTTSHEYWVRRYKSGGNSGAGSYDNSAKFKARFLNEFVREHKITSVIEHGSGDGNQLLMAEYPLYTGFDISTTALEGCRTIFKGDKTKHFHHSDDYGGEQAELALSLDVVYHLIEDDVFEAYMKRLFDSATRFVIVYSSNTAQQEPLQAPHVKHRLFTEWVERAEPAWQLIHHIPNEFPLSLYPEEGSFADFYVFAKRMN